MTGGVGRAVGGREVVTYQLCWLSSANSPVRVATALQLKTPMIQDDNPRRVCKAKIRRKKKIDQ